MKDKIKEYICEQFAKTKWPFISYTELYHLFGKEMNPILNDLMNEGFCCTRIGLNCTLIHYNHEHII